MENRLNIEELLERSDLVQQVKALRADREGSCLFGNKIAPLHADQITRLLAQGCDSPNWSRVYVTEEFDVRAVVHSRFEGQCVLGRFRGSRERAPGLSSRAGIDGSTLIDCEVGNDALVTNVGLIANYVIDEGAVVSSVGELTASTRPTFGNGTEIELALETGERAVRAFAELDVPLAAALACAPAGSGLRQAYEEFLRRYLEMIKLRRGYVGPQAIVRVCHRLRDVFVGEAAVIEGADAVVNSTLLSNRAEPTRLGDGVIIQNALIQWGCEVNSGAIVDRSVLTEHSHVERHGKVTHSLIGPNTGIGEGEVTSSLLGPFVGFHHQALLIAAYWPQGKGNIGYGANVGSNHTGKAPDQEIWPAEGMFFGLGVNIKFPSHFANAPYTIIASGVTTLPQKVEFPFSLINNPGRVYAGVSPAFNEIIPGWVLAENPYALARNETKFRDRNRARRMAVEFAVLRPETVEMIKEARRRLQEAPAKEPASKNEPVLYFERDVPGLGKNYMLTASRDKAIETYSFYLRFYALRGFYRQLVKLDGSEEGERLDDLEDILTRPAETPEWAHQIETLKEELPEHAARDLLDLWVEHHGRYAEAVRTSKMRDDERGARVIPDYKEIHRPASEDKVIRAVAAENEEIQKRVVAWLHS